MLIDQRYVSDQHKRHKTIIKIVLKIPNLGIETRITALILTKTDPLTLVPVMLYQKPMIVLIT